MMDYTFYIWPLLIAAAFLSGIGLYLYGFRDVPAVRPFRLLMWLYAVWSTLYALFIATSTNDLALKFALDQTQIVVAGLIAPAIFVLALEYAQPAQRLTHWALALFLAVPIISTLFVLSSPYHQLFRYNFKFDLSGPLPLLLSDKGPVFWISQLYSIILILVSCVILVLALRSQKIYTTNSLLLLLGILVPFTLRVLFEFGISPIHGFDMTPLAFIISGVLYAYALVDFHLFDVVPIARNAVMDHIQEIVMVLDMHGHIVEFNRAAQFAVGLSKGRSFGAKPKTLTTEWANFFEKYRDVSDIREEINIDANDSSRVYDVFISPIKDSRQRQLGRLFVLHDVTRHQQSENALRIKDRAIASSIDAIAISDLDGTITYVNPAFIKLWGYQNEKEVLGRNASAFWHDQEDFEQITQILEQQGGWIDESIGRHKNGSTFDVKVSASIASDVSGKPAAILAAFIDITEKKKAEEIVELKLTLSEFAISHSIEEVMQNALDGIEQITGSTISFYHLVAPDRNSILLQAWSTRTLQVFCQTDRKELHYSVDKAGIWVDCLREQRPVIHNDYSSVPNRKGLPADHAPIIRELVVPIFRMDHVVAILGIGNKPSDYDHRDVELAKSLANIVWEIFERKRDETEILRLSSFPQLNPNPVLELDVFGNITFYNGATRFILESQGLDDPRVFIPNDLDLMQIMKDGNISVVSREVKIKDIIVAETIHFAQVFNSVRIYAIDITKRKQTEEQLSQLSRAVEQSPTSIVITDIEGAIEYVNPGFTKVTGYSFEEVHGQNPRVLNSGETSRETFSQMWNALLSGKDWRGEFINRKKNGDLYYEAATVSPIVDQDGNITHYLAVKEDITERKESEKQLRRVNQQLQEQLEQIQGLQAILREQAIRDPLTSLYNRRFLYETLEREMARAERENYPISFVMIDVDHFKSVNDRYGHEAGDLILQNLAAQLLTQTRTSDIVCRYGGEEFLLVLPNTPTEAALQSADRWREDFQNSKLRWGDAEIGATLSLGIATFPINGVTSKEILSAADSAMYLAKSQGRNCVVLAKEFGDTNVQH